MADDEQRHGEGTYQMLWDCRFCGTKKLLGVTHRHCPNCGAAQDPEWRYFPAEADMVRLEDHQYVGADKMCPACGQPNSAASTYCVACGADLATGEVVQTRGMRELGTGSAETDTRRDVTKDKFDAEMSRIQAEEQAQPVFLGLQKTQLWVIGGVLLLLVICAGIIFAVTYRKDAKGTVDKLTWSRTVEIETFTQVSDGDWRDSMPGDAYDRSCSEKRSGSERVAVGSHEECRDVDQGDGSMRRECRTVTDYENRDVYDTWCDYRVDRWVETREVKSEGVGSSDPAPYWPDVTLSAGSGRFGQEREGKHHEDYAVHIRESGGKEYTCTFDDQAEWQRYTPGAAVTMKVDLTGSADCGSLALAE
jgi:hypothetical protein